MSKYIEAEEHLVVLVTECSMWCKENHLTETFRRAIEALEIADSLEHAEEICIKTCRREGCIESECPHRARGKFCSDLADVFYENYNQALADIRGDTE